MEVQEVRMEVTEVQEVCKEVEVVQIVFDRREKHRCVLASNRVRVFDAYPIATDALHRRSEERSSLQMASFDVGSALEYITDVIVLDKGAPPLGGGSP